ncbi:hypothetical protein E4T56_gene6117, partial [Termitomyces sp. T112]
MSGEIDLPIVRQVLACVKSPSSEVMIRRDPRLEFQYQITTRDQRRHSMPPTPTADDDIPIPPNPNRPLDPHNHTPVPTHMLTLTSYSHRRGPLHPSPSPGLTFDVRALPNASKRLR